MLLDHLAAAEHHIAVGEQYVLRQRQIVDELERHGREKSETAKMARQLLDTFEIAQAAHVADRARLIEAVAGDNVGSDMTAIWLDARMWRMRAALSPRI